MPQRFSFPKAAPGVFDAMDALTTYLDTCSLAPTLRWLVELRVSQLNGCAYCIDMHWKDLVAHGESAQRLYSLDAWHESPFHTARERAALAWAEAVTHLGDGHVPDEVYAALAPHFTAHEICDLTLIISTANAWNRLAVASRLEPGTYTATPPVT